MLIFYIYKSNIKGFLFFYFIIFVIIKKILSEDCNTHTFSEKHFPKVLTLSNGYKLMISMSGIYSFYPKLSSIAYSYNFSSLQMPATNFEEGQSYIDKADMSQFSGVDDENEIKYVLCIVNRVVYVISEKGKVLFYKDISEDIGEIYFPISLVAYKYLDGVYYFSVGYKNDYFYIYFFYFKINFKSETSGEISLSYKADSFFASYNSVTYYVYNINLFCRRMVSSSIGIVLACFCGYQDSEEAAMVIAFDPDNEFSSILVSNTYKDSDEKKIKYISSAVNKDKTKALFCFVMKNDKKEDKAAKCLNYDINNNILSNVTIESDYCSFSLYGLKVYYFDKANEYVFSCVDGDKNFFMKRLDENFNIIDDNDIYVGKQFLNCEQYTSFSITYISKYKEYSIFINANCNNDFGIKIFMLSDTNCIMPSGEIEEDDEEDEAIQIETTLPKIESTLAKIDTTIIKTTIPKIAQITTIPIIKTTFIDTIIPITTIPRIKTTFIDTTIPITTIPIIKTTFIDTTIPKIIPITTFPSIKTTIISKIATSIIKIKTTTPIDEKKTDMQTESPCKNIKGTKYYEGKCICDTENGYFSVNTKSAENKCYYINDIPKNLYFNNLTNSYEVCYKTCATCNKSGTYLENNCLTCAANYRKEPEKNSSNCVDDCKYFYYYNAFNQYSCTDDDQCPSDASLIIRSKNKCVNKCSNDDTYINQYNGECLSSCPYGTEKNVLYLCQIKNVATCSSSNYKLDLEDIIDQGNVKLVAKNYAKEFYYTVNHISKFTSKNFTMVLYKNSSCIDELKLNITKIEYDSCIQQLKIDNNISLNKDLIIAVIDIFSTEIDKPITSFGFFHPVTGEKLDAAKSCSNKNVIMYENIINIIEDEYAIQLLKDQKIDIFDLKSDFYNDICFHFDSPNGKDATLQDRIKTFYPNITLCDDGCRNRGVNLTTMQAKCECIFHDLLSISILNNELIGDNILIKEAVGQLMDVLDNLNIEVLMCYKDVFKFYYFKRNIGGFIIIGLIILETISIIYFYLFTLNNIVRTIYYLTEKYFLIQKKPKIKKKDSRFAIYKSKITKNPPKRSHKKSLKEEGKKIINNNRIIKTEKWKDSKPKKKKKKSQKLQTENYFSKRSNDFLICNSQNNIKFGKYNIKKEDKVSKNKKVSKKSNDINIYNQAKKNNKKPFTIKKRNNLFINDIKLFKQDINLKQFEKPVFESEDYDDVVEYDKRSFCQYLGEEIKKKQILVDSFFISGITKPRPIKILIFWLKIDLYFLINGLFYSDSYISLVFNSTEKETFFSFVSRSLYRFMYCTIVGQIIGYIIQVFLIDEIEIRKIIVKEGKKDLNIRYEISQILKSMTTKIKILIIINYVISIFSWYYLSCFNNVYPHIKTEWIISSIFIILIVQILSIIVSFLVTSMRFISIKIESEKLFKLSLLLN